MVKVERSIPAPPSLAIERQKASGKYNSSDVVAQLIRDFGNKCYLCEMKDLQDPQIEHLIPHKNGRYSDLKFDWNNLFWSCSHCNNVKNNKMFDEGILDCCREDPEKYIRFATADGIIQIEALCSDEIVTRTVQLLNDVYNKTNTGMRIVGCAERVRRLNEEMNAFYKALEMYKDNPENGLNLRRIQVLLRRKSGFAAFKRQYIRDNREVFPELFRYVEVE